MSFPREEAGWPDTPVLVGSGASKGDKRSNPERAYPGLQQRVQVQKPAPGPTAEKVKTLREASRRKG